MKSDYENDNTIRGMVRCLPALSHNPPDSVVEAFDLLAEQMPQHEKMPKMLSYFKHIYVSVVEGKCMQYLR